ncbi:hypothetical protein FI667_g9236, partial [Globisporangium splendens]
MERALECDALLLLEKKSLFCGAKWKRERLALSTMLLEFSPKLQVVARFQDALYVVVRAFAPNGSPSNADNATDNKLKLVMEVRTMDDVRRAIAYQTAVRTTCIEFYVESAHEREQLLAFMNQLPFAVPVAERVASSPATSVIPETNVMALIDDAFHALSEAQDARTNESHSRALDLYKAAELGFARAGELVPDERTRWLFQERRQEIQLVIQGLEARMQQAQRQQQPPPPQSAEYNGSSIPAFPEPPAPPAETTTLNTLPTPSLGLDERLENLKKFAAQQNVERAQREHKPAPDDLRLRLQALKNEQPKTSSVDSLAERFQRLRGGNLTFGSAESSPKESSGDQEGAAHAFHRQSSVDRIIQQVQEEITLGIVDDLEDHDDGFEGCSDSDDVDEDDYSDSDDNDDWGNRKLSFPNDKMPKNPAIALWKMNKVMDLESGRTLAVLEGTVAALEVIATLPESCHDGAFMDAKPKLSDAVVETLERHVISNGSLVAGNQCEADERKRKQRIATDLHELLQRYDAEMMRVDDAIAQEQNELQLIENATNSLVMHFARIDEDRRNQLDELRAIDDAERRRRQRELNLFRFIQKLQALVRGFLVRRQYRLELQLLAHKKRGNRSGRQSAMRRKRQGHRPRRRKRVQRRLRRRNQARCEVTAQRQPAAALRVPQEESASRQILFEE